MYITKKSLKIYEMYEDTNNPVYKLTTNLQLVLINVLIGSIFEH